jgi:hypothetical protein
MPFVLVRVSVADYRKWMQVMENHVGRRMELGSKGTRVFRDAEHPDQILCLTEWGTFSKAREFMGWGDPDDIRKSSTVAGSPEVLFLEQTDVLPA